MQTHPHNFRPGRFERFRCRRGAILVLVLAFIILMSFITVAFLEDATSKIKYYGLFHNRDDLRVEAYSALETSLAVINQFREIDDALWGPAQGWGDPLAYSGVEFGREGVDLRVDIEDESGRFSLKNMEYETLMLIFEEIGINLALSEELADTLLDWMDEDDLRRLNGFDGDNYEAEDPPYAAANRPLRTWDELELIHGWHDAFYDEDGAVLPALAQFKSAVSLYNEGDVNVNMANDLVLQILERMGTIDAQALRDYKNGVDGIPGNADDRVIRERDARFFNSEGGGASVDAATLRLTVQARRGEAAFLISTLVSWAGSGGGSSGNTSGDADDEDDRRGQDEPEDATEEVADADAEPTPGSKLDSDSERRSATAARDSDAVDLGYPFQILSLTENRKI